LQGAASAVEEDLAGAGEPDGSRGAGEEGVAEDLFELADLLGEWRLGEMEANGGATEVELFGDCDKVTEMAKLYILIHMPVVIIAMNKILDVWMVRA
jgi:hypothetical protein